MRQESTNPARNCIPPSVDEAELLRAIEWSGYPLQGLVADKLKSLFGVTEEWGYIDRDTKEHRSLDVFAYKRLNKDIASTIDPGLILLAECKRSVSPAIFFKNVTDRAIPGFPVVTGVKGDGTIWIREASRNRSLNSSASRIPGLDGLSFIEHGPPKCSAFSRAALSGSKVELSGTQLFNALILPLVKALDHACDIYKDKGRRSGFAPKLVVSIGVLDAPMILVESPNGASDPILTPWVRVVRQESVEDTDSLTLFRYYCVEIIHIDYFDEFVSKHLMPFAEEFGRRALRMARILLEGGEVPDLDNWNWDQVR